MGLRKADALSRVASGARRHPGPKTTYKPEYCEQVIAWGKEGKSAAWMASRIGRTVETLRQWRYAFPEFQEAMSLAEAHSQAWWEDQAQASLCDPKFNGNVWIKNMAGRFKRDWTDTSKVEHDASANFVDLLKEVNGSSASLVSKS